MSLGFRKELGYLTKTEVVWGYKGQFIKVIKDKFGVIKGRFGCLVVFKMENLLCYMQQIPK